MGSTINETPKKRNRVSQTAFQSEAEQCLQPDSKCIKRVYLRKVLFMSSFFTQAKPSLSADNRVLDLHFWDEFTLEVPIAITV